jgi:hypothetical protein
MVTLAYVEEQLKRIGCNFRFWGRAEVRELANILLPEEIIAGCTNGRYEGGAALLVATDLRLLLVDRKPMFLAIEDIRFDMIAEMDYSSRLFDSTIRVITPTRTLAFSAWNGQRLRGILNYAQERVLEVRQPHLARQFLTLPKQRADASVVGRLAMRATLAYLQYFDLHTRVPVLMRRSAQPRFY